MNRREMLQAAVGAAVGAVVPKKEQSETKEPEVKRYVLEVKGDGVPQMRRGDWEYLDSVRHVRRGTTDAVLPVAT